MQLVTAIVPAFNRATKIRAAIESILSQALPDGWGLEVISVDDGSSDGSAAVLDSFGDKVTVHRHATNRGAAAARNTGIAAARGDYVAFLDSDDIWLPGKLVDQIGAMQARGWQASCTAYRLSRFGREIVSPRWPTGTLDFNDLAWGCYVSPGSTLIARRSVFAEVGPIDTTLRRLEDWDWLLRYAEKYPLGFLAEPLARIEPSGPPNLLAARAAIEAVYQKHQGRMNGCARRNFLAGLDIERAALQYRYGKRAAAFASIIKSLARAPLDNRALAAVLHNRSLRIPAK